MKTLAEHNFFQINRRNSVIPVKNGIQCPVCKDELYDTNPMTTLLSDPPQKNIHCANCDWYGYRIA